jgi:hypothetical protein
MIHDDATRRGKAREYARAPVKTSEYGRVKGHTEAARLLAAAGSAHPERDAWTLIAWVEGTAFYALAGAGGTAVPPLAELRVQVASLYGDDAGAA